LRLSLGRRRRAAALAVAEAQARRAPDGGDGEASRMALCVAHATAGSWPARPCAPYDLGRGLCRLPGGAVRARPLAGRGAATAAPASARRALALVIWHHGCPRAPPRCTARAVVRGGGRGTAAGLVALATGVALYGSADGARRRAVAIRPATSGRRARHPRTIPLGAASNVLGQALIAAGAPLALARAGRSCSPGRRSCADRAHRPRGGGPRTDVPEFPQYARQAKRLLPSCSDDRMRHRMPIRMTARPGVSR